MSDKIQKLLKDEGGNYILPFFWQHGEDEATLREYMKVIDESSIKAVCVESRPHPDYAGPQWWHDMDIILDEARKRSMKVWILDDSHFPTGFANGAVDRYGDEFCRQSVLHVKREVPAGGTFTLTAEETQKAPERVKTQLEQFTAEKNPRLHDDDVFLAVYAVAKDGAVTDLMDQVAADGLTWTADADSDVYTIYLSRNYSYHSHYINMTMADSVKILIDAVYEPHWDHYKEDFGGTIAGFFSDEPEMGNGHMYEQTGYIGNPEMDYPWSPEVEEGVAAKLGSDWKQKLHLLFEDGDRDETAKVRLAYMDVITELVKKNFSFQLGDWCRAHGVKYIGHLIEDNDMHEKTGSSLGHYFRGLAGEDWAGIDDIGGQVYPQGENDSYDRGPFQCRNGEFYHFMLGKLGSSAAAVEPLKNGSSMCEIFGAYGWQEGVQLEKYLVDHFMVRGINHFVPHAFSPKAFPDPDCPPHFYAHGHNPQCRAFGSLMKYTNRVLELINDGRHVAPVAVIYSAEGVWTDRGHAMEAHAVSRPLTENQIEFDFVPQDVFMSPDEFKAGVADGKFTVNTQDYSVIVVPETTYIRAAFAKCIPTLAKAGVKVLFVNRLPEGILEADGDEAALLADVKANAKAVSLDDLVGELWEDEANELVINPDNSYMRYIHYEHADGSAIVMFVNEGTSSYEGAAQFTDSRKAYWYDAWDNTCHPADFDGQKVTISVEPRKSAILVLDADVPEMAPCFIAKRTGAAAKDWDGAWKRSLTSNPEYPNFGEAKEVTLPDHIEEELPVWSGIARYENQFTAEEGKQYFLEISDAGEAVEVFVNDRSLGYQIVPPYQFDLTSLVKAGDNEIRIEVATTLEREMSTIPDPMAAMLGKKAEPTSRSGLTGTAALLEK